MNKVVDSELQMADLAAHDALAEEHKSPTTLKSVRKSSTSSTKTNLSLKDANIAPFTDDSGNYTSDSNFSDCPFDTELQSNATLQHLLSGKDEALFVALQDVRKLRSELERISKSEQWYKQELRTEKTTRYDVLERLHLQERNYVQENLRLQRECKRLYTKCSELEQTWQAQHAKVVEQLQKETEVEATQAYTTTGQFEIEQQQALINDQKQLIAVLRKQKAALLEDLKKLDAEHHEKVLTLQRTLASIEMEKTQLTAQYQQLFNERNSLQLSLEQQAANLKSENAEKQELRETIVDLKKTVEAKEQQLAQKEAEIAQLHNEFKTNLNVESNMDEVHRLSVEYQADFSAKTAEIALLKRTLVELQEELHALGDLQMQNEQQSRVIDQLNVSLATRNEELESCKQNAMDKVKALHELQLRAANYCWERDEALKQLTHTRTTLSNVEQRMEKLEKERQQATAKMQSLELELNELKGSKRAAVVMPALKLFEADSAAVAQESTETKQSEDDAIDERLRILTKVLEAEYRRKMKRYDLHIRTLLSNVKELKKAARATEQKAAQLSVERETTALQLQDLQMTKRQLEEMRLKYEQSQSTIKALEEKLQIERKRFEASDLGKSTSALEEPTHEVANLIDDYKKLIQQSAAATQRPKTSAILDLIQRSNQCVPNFCKLEATIDELRNDIQQYLATSANNDANLECTKIRRAMPSLLDELRVATATGDL